MRHFSGHVAVHVVKDGGGHVQVTEAGVCMQGTSGAQAADVT